MQVVICKDSNTAAALAAKILADRIQANPKIVLGLATGRTMERVYENLRQFPLKFADVSTFNLDEYIGIKRSDARSYWHYMHAHLFDHVDIKDENIHVLDGMAPDIWEAAAAYEDEIEVLGGIDLQLLGIGRDGHIGFNEPLSSFGSRTRTVYLTQTTREQNAPMFGGDFNQVPECAVTMGVGTILEARELMLLATGVEKAEILAQAIEGPITSMISATAIQLHPDCRVVTDVAAASALRHKDCYRRSIAGDIEFSEYKSMRA